MRLDNGRRQRDLAGVETFLKLGVGRKKKKETA